MKNNKIKNIVYCGIYNGYALSTTLWEIAFEIATEEQKELMKLWSNLEDFDNLKNEAEELYNKYRKEYYSNGGN